jgi:hypothetical protein
MQRKSEALRSYIQWWSIIKKLGRGRLRRASSRCLHIWSLLFGSC